MSKLFAPALLLVLLTGCASTYNMEVLKAPAGKLHRDYSVAVQAPQNGRYGKDTYQGSGQMTADALRAEFLRYSSEVNFVPSGSKKTDYSGIISSYYVRPEILHWEDRATEWSGKPDRIKIKVDLFDTSNMSHQSSVIFSGKSKWATWGGDNPEDLLPEPIKDYLETLY